jgi:hypothetical protein
MEEPPSKEATTKGMPPHRLLSEMCAYSRHLFDSHNVPLHCFPGNVNGGIFAHEEDTSLGLFAAMETGVLFQSRRKAGEEYDYLQAASRFERICMHMERLGRITTNEFQK